MGKWGPVGAEQRTVSTRDAVGRPPAVYMDQANRKVEAERNSLLLERRELARAYFWGIGAT